MPGHNSVNHPVRRTVKDKPNETTELYQTCDRGFPVEAEDEEITDDEIPMGMLPSQGASDHNVNTIVQPSITVQSSIRRLKATTIEAMDSTLEYTDYEGEQAMNGRWRFADDLKTIKTSVSGLDIVVGVDKGDYYAFLVTKDKPQGYVRFERRYTIPSHWNGIVFTPHSYLRKEYRGKSYISSLYKWFLNSGHALLSSEEHSVDASTLWKGLLEKYPHQFLKVAPRTPYAFVAVDEGDGSMKTVALVAGEGTLKKLLKGIK